MNDWQYCCEIDDLVPGSGVAALIDGAQVALFYLPDHESAVYGIDNLDPISGANVLAHGIVGDIRGELVVASPLYKQHYSLLGGHCLEADECVAVWQVRVDGERVYVRPGERAVDAA